MAISAGALAGIVVGAVAIVGLVGGFGGKKGYDIYIKKRGELAGASDNPLYKEPEVHT